MPASTITITSDAIITNLFTVTLQSAANIVYDSQVVTLTSSATIIQPENSEAIGFQAVQRDEFRIDSKGSGKRPLRIF